MIKAVPYIILGVFATIAIVLYIAGCAITKNWWLMFVIIPAIICCVLALILMPMLDDSYTLEGCAVFTPDSTLFYLMFFIITAVGLPLVFYHCGTIKALCFGMNIGGDVAVLIGFIAFLITANKVDE